MTSDVLAVHPLSPSGFAAEVRGVDLDRSLPASVVDALRAAFCRHPVLCVRTEGLLAERFLALTAVFGAPRLQVLRDHRRDDHPEISVISSEQFDRRGDGRRVVFGAAWHTDDSYLADPAVATALYAHRLPSSGGDTLFADCTAAYEALGDSERASLEGVTVEHRYQSRRNLNQVPARSPREEAETPPVTHAIVRVHPDSGRRALYLNPNRMDHVVDMVVEQGDALLDRLIAHATSQRFLYRHCWHPHDVVLWDNRATMHKASDDYGEEHREMHRVLLEAR